MNVSMIEMPVDQAKEAFKIYREAVRADRSVDSRWKKEDAALAQAYRRLSKGERVLDLYASMKMAGLRDDGYPRLAICRSDAEKCWYEFHSGGTIRFASNVNALSPWGRQPAAIDHVDIPPGTIPEAKDKKRAATIVPMIPPNLRPKHALSNYHTLWEVESWTLEPPRDPILLRHLSGALYAVLAVWDLTELERSVLRLQR